MSFEPACPVPASVLSESTTPSILLPIPSSVIQCMNDERLPFVRKKDSAVVAACQRDVRMLGNDIQGNKNNKEAVVSQERKGGGRLFPFKSRGKPV